MASQPTLIYVYSASSTLVVIACILRLIASVREPASVVAQPFVATLRPQPSSTVTAPTPQITTRGCRACLRTESADTGTSIEM